MLRLNRQLGLEGEIPRASGYWSDPKTRDAIDRFETRYADRLPRGELVRDG